MMSLSSSSGIQKISAKNSQTISGDKITPNIEKIVSEEEQNLVTAVQEAFTDNNIPEISQNVDTIISDTVILPSFISSESHTTGRDSYIIDFGFQYGITFSAKQTVIDKRTLLGRIYLGLNESAHASLTLTIPVNITIEYNPDVNAGDKFKVNTTLYTDDSTTEFRFDFGFSFTIDYDLPFIDEGSFTLYEYEKSIEFFNFETPFEPTPISDLMDAIGIDSNADLKIPLDPFISKLPYGVGILITNIFDFNLVIKPTLDVDLSTFVNFEGLGEVSSNFINFEKGGQKSFTIDIDQFSQAMNNVGFSLSDFSLDPYISAIWELQIGFDENLLANSTFLRKMLGGKSLDIYLFTAPRIRFPVSLVTDDVAIGEIDILPSSLQPEFAMKSYLLDDNLNNSNTFLEPGELISIENEWKNYGLGVTEFLNVTSTSSDASMLNTTRNFQSRIYTNGKISDTFYLKLDSGYAFDNINITHTLSWRNTNGSIYNEVISQRVPVLLSGRAAMYIANYQMVETINNRVDAGDTIRTDLALSKAGSATVTYVYIELYDVDTLGYSFSSNNSYQELISGDINQFTSNSIFLTTPIDYPQSTVTLYFYVYYETSAGNFDEYYEITISILPQSPIEEISGVYYASGLTDNGDSNYDAGEDFIVEAELYNNGTGVADLVFGEFSTNSSDVIFENVILYWDNHSPNTYQLSSNQIQMYLNPFALNQTVLVTFYWWYYNQYNKYSSDQFTFNFDIVQQPEAEISLSYSFDIDPSPGVDSLLDIDIEVTSGVAMDVIVNVMSNNSEIQLVDPISEFGNIKFGDIISGDGFQLYTPKNFEGGNVKFIVILNATTNSGIDYSWIGEFMIFIAQGDITVPIFEYTYPQEINPGEMVTLNVEFLSHTDVVDLYVAIYNFTSENYDIYIYDVTGYSRADIDLGSLDEDTYFVIILYDAAGNAAFTGEDAILIDVLTVETTTSSSTSGVISSTTTTTTVLQSSTSQSSSKASKDSSPINYLFSLFGLITISMSILRIRRKTT